MVNQRIIASDGSMAGQFVEKFQDARAERIAYLGGKTNEGAP